MVKPAFYLFGIPRSGHTAILYWLAAQVVDNFDPYNQYKQVKSYPWLGLGPDVAYIGMNVIARPQDAWLRFAVDVEPFVNEAKVVIVDDQRLAESFHKSEARHKKVLAAWPERQWLAPVVVARDYYNNLASRIKKRGYGKSEAGLLTERWLQVAREVSGKTAILPNKVSVLYDKWLVSRQYRAQVCERLGIPFTDAGFDYVPYPGSSFKSGSLLERWKQVSLEQLKSHATPEIIQLNQELFGIDAPWQ